MTDDAWMAELDSLAEQFWYESRYSGRDGQNFDHQGFAAALLAHARLRTSEPDAHAAVLAERERCARLCEEMGEHWSDYKDTALLNGDVELSNAASGEPRAAAALASLIRQPVAEHPHG